MTEDKKSDERDKVLERKANEIILEESCTDEIYQIENTTIFNSINNQESRGNDDLVDTDTNMEHDNFHDTEESENNTNKNISTVICETKQDDEVIDEKIDSDAAKQTNTELEDITVTDFDDLNLPGANNKITTKIIELQQDNEVLDNVAVHYTENIELTTTAHVSIQMTELPLENVNT